MSIDLFPVSSGNLAAVGYDAETETMAVQFRSGTTWEYQGVPLEDYDAVRTAASPGGEFNARIKGTYEGSKA